MRKFIMKSFNQKIQMEYLGTVLLCMILCFGCVQMHLEIRRHTMQQHIAQKILRFHVRANSDSASDQELKLKVRNAIGSYMQEEIGEVESLAECRKVVIRRLPQIEKIARSVLAQNQCDYPVTATVEKVAFPVKSYGDYTFPAGTYEALNVVIGEGNGHNWWCVMYPSMCFHGAVYEVVDEDAKKSLRQVLSPEEYESVLKEKNYRVRFKYLKVLNKLLY